jgi:hypothetical protein
MAEPTQRALLSCAECGRPDDDENERGWCADLGCSENLDETPEVMLFCPDCSAREFDGDSDA